MTSFGISHCHTYADAQQRRKKGKMLFVNLKHIMTLDRLYLQESNGTKSELRLAAAVQKPLQAGKPHPAAGMKFVSKGNQPLINDDQGEAFLIKIG